MHLIAILVGIALILIVLGDAFETIVLPRGLTRTVRLARSFYRSLWWFWAGIARAVRNMERREALLSYFGPLSLLLLLGVWAVCLIAGFGLIRWGVSQHGQTLDDQLYGSAATFFTVGLGDAPLRTPASRYVAVAEAGTGLGLLAIVIGYLPVLYQSFSSREIAISLLDARAGSPPTAAELLRRHGTADGGAALNQVLKDWERWSAELLESHLSYPVLCYYRSQHDRQSWLAAMTAILDTCALVMVGVDGVDPRQARLTFAMARHAMVDLAAIFGSAPLCETCGRLPVPELSRLRLGLAESGVRLGEGADADMQLQELRDLYEPYVDSLAQRLAFTIPPFMEHGLVRDAWEATAFHHNHPS